jgi:hypothetical protein
MGAEDLITNGKQVAVIEYHTGDTYTNSYGTARLSYYNLGGTPTAWFDGGLAVVGGSGTTSMYPQYLIKYNQRINVPSSFTIDMIGSKIGTNDYQVTVTIEKVDATAYSNLKMHFAVTQSDIAQNWQGMTELNNVERLMVPSQSGTAIDFSTSNTKEIYLSFTMQQAWVIANSDVIVFIQNSATKEIYQGIIRELSEFDFTNNTDAAVVNSIVPRTVCKENFIPKLKLGNYGTDNLTSLDINLNVNNEPVLAFNWTGNLAFTETEIIELPEVIFTIVNENNFTIDLDNPNGQTDQYPSNDLKIIPMEDAPDVNSPVSLALKLDANPGQTTWSVLNSIGTILYSGGPYTQPNQFILEDFDLNENDCYTFIIYDSGGDGLTGNGTYKLAYNSSMIFFQGKDFGFEEQVQFGIGLTGLSEANLTTDFIVTPNPISDRAEISFFLAEASPVHLKIYSPSGALVFDATEQIAQAGNQSITFKNEDLIDGIYYLQLSIGETVLSKKLIVKH